jgi:diguanylate cyclase (GGDEF)-like protein
MRILIAEDDFTSRTMLAGLLKKHGHEVVETTDGAAAWDKLRQPDAPLLIILDWMMPHIDGLELVRRVRAAETEQPPYILMLTTKKDKADIIAGLDAGANDYLTKPFDAGELRARVEVGRRMVELQRELVESRKILAHQSTHDPLTGVLNRRGVLERLREELSRAERYGDLLGIGMVDIDHFKQVNDTYGHQTGDDILGGLTVVLKESLREYDSVGRIGGEEFLLIAPLQSEKDCLPVFKHTCRKVAEKSIPSRSGALSVTISIGVVLAGGNDSVDEILAAADKALYRAKDKGRNQVCLSNGCSTKEPPCVS